MREGVGKGFSPTLQVLEFGHADASRHSSDLLPYLPKFRKHYTSLPSRKGSLRLRVTSVPLNDIECITQTVLKVSLYAAQFVLIEG